MKFTKPAPKNPIDNQTVMGKPTPRIDGPLKTTGQATYAYEWKDVVENPAYGWIIGSSIANGRIKSMKLDAAKSAPGVIDILTYKNAGIKHKGDNSSAQQIAGPKVEHYHQAVAMVIAESFEEARAAAELVEISYTKSKGKYVLEDTLSSAKKTDQQKDVSVGDFASAYESAPVKLDVTYKTSRHSHAMMEPHATIANWEDNKVTVWTANQMINWSKTSLAKVLGVSKEDVRLVSPFIGGGFGGKLFILSDASLAAAGARLTKRPVKVTLQRALIFNNTAHRASTIQNMRLGANENGELTAVAHKNWSSALPEGGPESGVLTTGPSYKTPNMLLETRLSVTNLPPVSAMRAPGDMPGSIAIEVAMDEMAEKLKLDPIEFRLLNDTQTNPETGKPFSRRKLAECLQQGAEKFGWSDRSSVPAQKREGSKLIGMGVASAVRGGPASKSAARVQLTTDNKLIVETDMTDIGTGSYTILAQTAAEMMGLPLSDVDVRLGDSNFPAAAGSGGQWGATSSTSGVYVACVNLRKKITDQLGLNADTATFENGNVTESGKSTSLSSIVKSGPIEAEGEIDFSGRGDDHSYYTFGAHFVEVEVDIYTAETRIRRMLAVCDSGRIFNPVSARSQVIGGMTMGAGAALMEELHVDPRYGHLANHDLAQYEVPVHMDIPHQEVFFLEGEDPLASPTKGSGVGELGICGVSAAIGNAIYNATGVRVREFPL